MDKHIFSHLLPLAFYFLLLSSASAGEILGGRFYTVPEKVYVNQAFDIHLDLEVSFGSELEDLRINDFPNTPDLLTVGRLESLAGDRVTRSNQTFTVHRLVAKASGHRPADLTFSPTVQCMLVERRNAGFFSHWQSFPKTKRLDPFRLNILPLPEAGRPAHFSGAIGAFALTGGLSQSAVQPGDIVTLSLELAGDGWLGDNAALPSPPPSPLFKAYPAKDVLREATRLKTEQVFIPQNTNATEIAALRFCFFNPATGAYEESVAGPFRLTFDAAPAAARADDVRVIDTARQPASAPPAQAASVTIARVNETVRHARPLLIGGACVLSAVFMFFLLYSWRKRLACLLLIPLLVLAGWFGHRLSGREETTSRTLARRVEVRFAPSASAATLFTLNPGTAVTPLESAPPWLRIDAAGRRGWIPSDTLQAR